MLDQKLSGCKSVEVAGAEPAALLVEAEVFTHDTSPAFRQGWKDISFFFPVLLLLLEHLTVYAAT